jgi:SAM-dependent methyltransferase
MVWKAEGPQGFESAKVAFELVPYFHGRCLDLGCGPRKVLPSDKIIGVDSNKDWGLFGVRANPDVEADVTDLGIFADESFDCVFSSHTLEHIEDYKAALAEWWRVVKPGGVLILYLPHADWYPNIGMPGANPDHVHDFRNADVEAAMRAVAEDATGWMLERDEVRSEGNEYSFLQVYRKREFLDTTCAGLVPAPRPEKSLGLVRLGAFGDALWITTILPALKAEGWHITLYTQRQGETSLRLDPHVDEFVVQPDGIFGDRNKDAGDRGSAAQYQGAYWMHCERKHDRFINLVGCVERHLLPSPADPNFYLPKDQRHRLMNRNYYEAVAEWAGVKFDGAKLRVKFTPSDEEKAWAQARRAQVSGPFVVINPSGSSLPKWWPHAQECMNLLAAAGVGGVLVGDLRGHAFKAPDGWEILGTRLDLRKVYTLAALADVVIGTESAVVNAVAHEKPLKIVLLSHSTAANLTRDWDRVIALEPEGLPCYPCHRIHGDWTHCTMVAGGAAACQYAFSAKDVTEIVNAWISGELREAA